MAEPLRLWVATPEEALLDLARIDWARILLADGGSIGVRPGHAPLLAETAAGPLYYGTTGGERTLDLERGILLVDRRGISIFTSGTPAGEARGAKRPAQALHFRRLAYALLQEMRAAEEKA